MEATGKRLTRLTATAISLTALPVCAHHSFAMFDMSRSVTLEGTVKEFQWTNPHIWIQLLVKDPASGKDVEWAIEANSPSVLARGGWTRKSLQAGEVVSAVIHPLKHGDVNGGELATLTVNGQHLSNGGGPPPEGASGPAAGAR